MIAIELPWPEPCLWPNSRSHWTVKSQAAAAQKQEAFVHTRNAGGALFPVPTHLPVRLIFHKPNTRRRDLDNAQAAMKHALDGIAQAWQVDDSVFVPTSEWGEVRPPRGSVTVQVGEP